MNTQKYLWGALVLVVLIVGGIYVGSRSSRSGSSDTIKIAFLGPLSGDVAVYGENEKKGFDLAVDEINAVGGIDGRLLESVVEDTQCDPKRSVAAAQKVTQIDHVLAIVGDTCSSAVIAMRPILDTAKVPAITPTAGADSISGSSAFQFRNFVPNKLYAGRAAELFRSSLKTDRIAVLYIDNDLGKSLSDDMTQNLGNKVIFNEGYSSDTKDFRSLLTKLSTKNPGVVYLAGYYQDGALIIRQAHELGLSFVFFGSGDAYDDPQFIALAGADNLEGFTYLSVPKEGGPAYQHFHDVYVAKYQSEPVVYADYTYDTVQVIAEAIRDAKKKGDVSPEVIAQSLRTVEFQGASNLVKFNALGDVINPAIILKRISKGVAEAVK